MYNTYSKVTYHQNKNSSIVNDNASILLVELKKLRIRYFILGENLDPFVLEALKKLTKRVKY